MGALTLAHLREQNLPRCRRWHPDGAPPWTYDDWLLALGGEVGEALNVVKKLNRDRDGLAGNTRTRAELIADLGGELADVVIYLDICVGWEGYGPLYHGSSFDRVRTEVTRYRATNPNSSPSRLGTILLRVAGGATYHPGEGWAIDVVDATMRLALAFDIDLGAAVVAKFNATSEKFGFPERLVV